MDRLNSEGIARHNLSWALGKPHIVRQAINENRCLLCRCSPVNEAGLCEICVVLLDDDELKLVNRWTTGIGP